MPLFYFARVPVFIPLVIFTLSLVGCDRIGGKLTATPRSPLWSQYVSAHTSGLVSKQSNIRVVFVSDVIEADDVGKPADDFLRIGPKTPGKAVFVGQREIVFSPAGVLKAGELYHVTVKARDLMTLPEELKDFEFEFQVIRADFDVKVSGLAVDPDKQDHMLLQGVVATADVEDADAIEKLLEARYSSRDMKIDWRHSESAKEHAFVVAGIERPTQATKLNLAWDGDAIHVDRKGNTEVEVPALTVFAVTQVSAVHSPPHHIQILLSDNVDSRQNLNGLVRSDQGAVRVRVDGSTIQVFPESKFVGKVTLTLDAALRNERGTKLGQQLQREVAFASEKPQVRFVGKGVILPDNPVLSIPFEAVNVQSVQVTAFRIYDENVGQFLQVNKLDGEEELSRVGRFIWRKTLHLPSVNQDSWGRYSVDATKLLRDNPGGLFRLTLSINRGNSSYQCSEDDKQAPVAMEEPLSNNEDLHLKESSGWDFAEDYYQEGNEQTAWRDRDDPCKNAYYRFASGVSSSRNFLASNIGLVAKRDQRGNVLVVATSLQTAKPLQGVNVSLLNFQNQAVAKAVTGGDGFAEFPLSPAAFYVMAEHNGQKGYLKVNPGSARPVSHFDVGGDKVEAGIKGFIYGERGVWRPGDDIHLTFVLQDKDNAVPENHPVTVSLINPQGQLVEQQTNSEPVGDFYSFTMKTADDAPTGNWMAKAQLGGSLFSKPLKIETVMPNRLKVEFDPGKEAIYSDGRVKGRILGQWLHGATAADLKTDVSVRLAPAPTRFERYADYMFEDPARQFQGEPQTLFEGELDENGIAQFDKELLPGKDAPAALTARFTTRVFEPGGAFSSSQQSFAFYPYKHFVGIQVPKGDRVRGMLLTDTVHKIAIATLDAQGKPVSLKNVKASLYKVGWKWWWDKTDDGLAQYAQAAHNTALKAQTVSTSNGQGNFEFEIKYPEWGRYLVRVCDGDGGHCAGKVFYIDWPGWAGRAQEEGGAGASVLSFFSDKQEYEVGQTAIVQLPEATQGRALVTIESGASVLERRWIEFEAGKSKFELPVTAAMSPNVYVSVMLIQPHDGKNNDRPIRLYGVISLTVEDPGTSLSPVLKAADEWRPESKVTVEVSESKGREMTYTVAVVDEGLLGLTAFKTPDLRAHFYKKEALGVTTWDLYDFVAGAYGGDLERLLALGGDESLSEAEAGKEQKRFPPVVQVLGPFKLKSKDTARHELTLPQYIGAVRVMVVAGQRGAYGSANKSVFVRQPLSMLPTLPRVLGPDEEFTVPVSLFVMDDAIKDVSLKIEPDSHFDVVGKGSVQVRFDKQGEKLGLLTLKTRSGLGKGRVRFAATSGKHVSKAEVFIDIRSPNPATANVLNTVIKPGESWEQQVEPHGIPGTNEVSLEVSTVRPINLERHLGYLIRYPHGCLEQVTSSVFPQLYLSSFVRLSDAQKAEIDKNVQAGIERLRGFQTVNGGFVYWPGGFFAGAQASAYNSWASNYAGHFLIEAEKRGYYVPSQMLGDWVDHQKMVAQSWRLNGRDSALDQAYRLYVLALANQAALGAMNRLREMPNLDNTARWQLAAAYKLAGQTAAANELVLNLAAEVNQYSEPGFTFGSALRDQAIILNSLVVLDDLERAGQLAKQISEDLAAQRWHSTQTISYALLAMGKLVHTEKGGVAFTFEQSIGSSAPQKLKSDKPVYTEKLAQFPDDGDKVRIRNTSDKPLFVYLVVRGAARPGAEKAAAEGLELNVSYVDAKNNSIDVEQLRQGTDFVAEITVRNRTGRKLDNLALSYIAPSGWELLNPRMSSAGAPMATGIDYQDYRDDRVYTYFGLGPNESRTIQVRHNAVYPGSYYLPAVSVEAMYDATRHARSTGRWVKVIRPE